MDSHPAAVLGIHAFGAHDTAAALVDGHTGSVLFALAEERLSNVKHDARFPIGSVLTAVDRARALGLAITDVAVNFDAVEFIRGTLFREFRRLIACEHARRRLEEVVLDCFRFGDFFRHSGSFTQATVDRELGGLGLDATTAHLLRARIFWYFNWAQKHRHIEFVVRELFPEARFHRVGHHLCHAATAFYNSGFKRAAVLVVDGQGESDTVTVYRGEGTSLDRRLECGWPVSLGMFYLTVTEHLGFRLGDEYKVMGMAAYGSPRYLDVLREVVRYDPDHGLAFVATANYASRDKTLRDELTGHFMFDFTPEFAGLVPRRGSANAIEQVHFDLAASAQALVEEIGVSLARRAIELTGCNHLALAGGVALNGLMNAQIRRASGCHDLFVFPAASDDGTAVGAAQYVAARTGARPHNRMQSTFFGASTATDRVEPGLDALGAVYQREPDIHQRIASALVGGSIVARYQAGDEFGPRALGHRSILANPMLPDMKDRVNARIKHRESFRPFAPACMAEHATHWFDTNSELPFMVEVVEARDIAKSRVPAVVHEDGSARLQSVAGDTNPGLYPTLAAFYRLTGVPVLLNTSFNVNGEAIVNTVEDAVESFLHMDIDFLAVGDYWLDKRQNLHLRRDEPDGVFLDRRKQRYHQRFPHVLRNFKLDRYEYLDALAPAAEAQPAGPNNAALELRVSKSA